MRLLTVMTIVVLCGATCSMSAFADQLTLGGSTSSVYYCSTGSDGLVTVSATDFTAGCKPVSDGTVSGAATFESPKGTIMLTGTYTIGFPVPPIVLGPENALNQFPTNGVTSSFNFNGGVGGALSGIISWNFVVDHTANPRWDGNLQIGSVSGTNPSFVNDFHTGDINHIDFTMDAITFLADLATTGGTTSNTISSGQVSPVPEVSSLLLFGTGMLLALSVISYRRKRFSM